MSPCFSLVDPNLTDRMITPGKGSTTTAQGSLQALLQIREDLVPTYQSQLDELARGLVCTFAETSQIDDSKMPGLFTWSGGSVPTEASAVKGLAGSIKVSKALISCLGGNPNLLRDGGISGEDYVANATGDASFTAHLDAVIDAMGTSIDFDPSTEVNAKASILELAFRSLMGAT